MVEQERSTKGGDDQLQGNEINSIEIMVYRERGNLRTK